MGFFGVLEKILEVPQIKFEQKKCLKARFSGYVCDKCNKICPCQAIEGGDKIRVIEEKCEACGLCAGICPGEAFSLEQPNYAELVAEVREKQRITLACQKTQLLGACTIPCLGYLPEILLMGFVLSSHQVRILHDTRKCADCSRQAGELIEERLSRVKEVACAVGKGEVLLIDNGEQEETVSRGEFFAFLKDRTKALAHRLPIPFIEKIHKKETNKKFLPASRKMFLLMVGKGLSSQESVALSGGNWPFSQIQVNNQCNGCGDCTRFCPTGALKLEDNEKVKALMHTPIWCITCGLCMTKCPRKAISKLEALDLSRVLTGEDIPVQNLSVYSCPRCGRPVNTKANNSEQEICRVCKQEFRHRLNSKKLMLNF